MIELSSVDFHRIAPLFEGIELWPSLPHSVIERNQTGRIFVDDATTPCAAFVCHSTGYSYVGGDSESFSKELERELFDCIDNDVLHLCGMVGYWRDRLRTFMGDASKPYQMLSYRLDKSAFGNLSSHMKLPHNCTMKRVDKSLADLIDRDPDSGILWYYESIQQFCEHGLGYGLFEGDDLASFCFSVLVGGGWSDPQLRTGELFRRRGYATQVAAAYIADCLDASLEPTWHTWPGNTVSERLATHMGFRLIGEFTVYRIERELRQ